MKPLPTAAIARRIKLQHLSVITAVARAGSMARAARDIALSQPVVSKVVAELEHTLGVPLFDRSPQGVTPTLYCRALLERSRNIFDELRTGIDEIGFLSDPDAGELRIGSTEPLLAGLVTASLERMWEAQPRLAARIVQADSLTLINRDLAERRIELAVIPLQEGALRDDLQVSILYEDFWHVVASRTSPWARRRKLTLADLAAAPWCATPLDTPIGGLLKHPFAKAGLEPPRLAVASVMSPQLVARLLENGRMVAVMADSLLRYFYADRLPLRRLPVELPAPRFSVGIVRARNRTISPVAARFINTAREIAADLEAKRARG